MTKQDLNPPVMNMLCVSSIDESSKDRSFLILEDGSMIRFDGFLKKMDTGEGKQQEVWFRCYLPISKDDYGYVLAEDAWKVIEILAPENKELKEKWQQLLANTSDESAETIQTEHFSTLLEEFEIDKSQVMGVADLQFFTASPEQHLECSGPLIIKNRSGKDFIFASQAVLQVFKAIVTKVNWSLNLCTNKNHPDCIEDFRKEVIDCCQNLALLNRGGLFSKESVKMEIIKLSKHCSFRLQLSRPKDTDVSFMVLGDQDGKVPLRQYLEIIAFYKLPNLRKIMGLCDMHINTVHTTRVQLMFGWIYTLFGDKSSKAKESAIDAACHLMGSQNLETTTRSKLAYHLDKTRIHLLEEFHESMETETARLKQFLYQKHKVRVRGNLGDNVFSEEIIKIWKKDKSIDMVVRVHSLINTVLYKENLFPKIKRFAEPGHLTQEEVRRKADELTDLLATDRDVAQVWSIPNNATLGTGDGGVLRFVQSTLCPSLELKKTEMPLHEERDVTVEDIVEEVESSGGSLRDVSVVQTVTSEETVRDVPVEQTVTSGGFDRDKSMEEKEVCDDSQHVTSDDKLDVSGGRPVEAQEELAVPREEEEARVSESPQPTGNENHEVSSANDVHRNDEGESGGTSSTKAKKNKKKSKTVAPTKDSELQAKIDAEKAKRADYLEIHTKNLEEAIKILKEKMRKANESRQTEKGARIEAEKSAAFNKDRAAKAVSLGKRLHERDLELEVKNEEIEKLKTELASQPQRIEKLEEDKKKREQYEKEVRNSNKRLQTENESLKNNVSQLTVKLQEMDTVFGRKKLQHAEEMGKLRGESEKKMQAHQQETRRLQNLLSQKHQEALKKDEEITSLKSERSVYRREVNNIIDQLTTDCTCSTNQVAAPTPSVQSNSPKSPTSSVPSDSPQSPTLVDYETALRETNEKKNQFEKVRKSQILASCKEKINMLLDVDNDGETKEMANSELDSLAIRLDDYSRILEINTRILIATEDTSKMIALPQIPAPSKKFMEVFRKTGVLGKHNCGICWELIRPDEEEIACGNCKKVYHFKCLRGWYEKKLAEGYCSFCNAVLRDPAEYPVLGP